jgi:hypothetical protein
MNFKKWKCFITSYILNEFLHAYQKQFQIELYVHEIRFKKFLILSSYQKVMAILPNHLLSLGFECAVLTEIGNRVKQQRWKLHSKATARS